MNVGTQLDGFCGKGEPLVIGKIKCERVKPAELI